MLAVVSLLSWCSLPDEAPCCFYSAYFTCSGRRSGGVCPPARWRLPSALSVAWKAAEWWASGGRAADAAVSVMPKSLPTSASWIPSRVGWDYPALSQCFQIAEKYREHGKGVAARRLRGGALACPPVTVWQGQGTWEASGLGAGVFPAHSQATSPAGYVQLPEPDQLGRRGWAVTCLVSCFPASGQLRSCKNP